MNQKGLSTLQTLLWKGIRIFGIVVLTSGMFPNSAMAATTYNLTGLGSSADINGATFLQFDPIDSAGTGNFDSFVRIQATGTEKGYNTDNAVLEFDEKSGTWTHSLLLSAIPSVYIGGVWYREFQVDINETTPKSYLSLNELQIFTAASPDLTIYDAGTPPYPGGTDPSIGAATTLVYNLDAYDDATVDFDYALQSGSGEADYLLLVPDDNFGSDPNCVFGGSSCTTYVYFYSNFGDPYGSDDGFEEWAVSVGTARIDPPDFEVTKWVYDYTDKQWNETDGWDFSATVEIDDPLEAVDDYYWFNPVAGLASGPLGTTQLGTTGTDGLGTALWSWWPGTLAHPKSLNSMLSFYEVPQSPYVFVGAQCTRTYSDGSTSPLVLQDAAGDPYIGNLTAGSPAYVFYGADGIADRSSSVHCDVYNNKPTAVTMSSFTATPEFRTILVEWQTILQTDTDGFNLYRSLYENGEREFLGYIPVKIPEGGVAEYEYLDDEVLPGKTYYYWLEVVAEDTNDPSPPIATAAATWWWNSYIPMITR